jgi:hypothetical protein
MIVANVAPNVEEDMDVDVRLSLAAFNRIIDVAERLLLFLLRPLHWMLHALGSLSRPLQLLY